METLVKKTNAAGQSVSVQTSELLRVLSALIEINREPMTLSDDTVGEISGAIKAQVVAHLNEDLNSISDEVSGKVTQPVSRAAGRVESAVTHYETVLRDLQAERAHWEVRRAAERGWLRQLLRTVGAFGLHAAALLLSVVWLVMPVGAAAGVWPRVSVRVAWWHRGGWFHRRDCQFHLRADLRRRRGGGAVVLLRLRHVLVVDAGVDRLVLAETVAGQSKCVGEAPA